MPAWRGEIMSKKSKKLIASFQKNSSEAVKVHLQQWQRVFYMDIRVWTMAKDRNPEGGAPTKKGITLSVALLGQLRQAIDKAVCEVEGAETAEDPAGSGKYF
jgi:hypothetical protein